MAHHEKIDLLCILNKLLEEKSYSQISKELNVAPGTIKRWKELNNIPSAYCFELMKLANIHINYSGFSYKEKDQFFTPKETSQYCYDKTKEILKQYNEDESSFIYIEPSAGAGSFWNILEENRRIGIDIEPRCPGIIEGDYLDWVPSNMENSSNKYIVLGNPPFGLRGQMALKFINHSYQFADYVCFILPQLFESDGKGVPRKRVKGYNLLHSEKINNEFEDPDKKKIKVECIFQIWSKNHVNPNYELKEIDKKVMKVYSLSDGGSPSTTRNKKMHNNCDIYLPSTCFGKENMKYYSSFESLPNRKGYGIVFLENKEENIEKFKKIIWHDVAFLSTNSAYNIRSSQIIQQF